MPKNLHNTFFVTLHYLSHFKTIKQNTHVAKNDNSNMEIGHYSLIREAIISMLGDSNSINLCVSVLIL